MTVRLRRSRSRRWRGALAGLALLVGGFGLGAGNAIAQEMDWEGLSEAFAITEDTDWLPAVAEQGLPRSAACPDGSGRTLVVWEDHRSSSTNIYGGRLSADGVPLDPAGVPIATGASIQQAPALASGGGVCLATWVVVEEDGWRLEGSRLSEELEVLDPTPITVTESDSLIAEVEIAFGTESFMVVWTDNSGSHPVTHGARVSPEGMVLDAEPIQLSTGSDQWSGSSLAFDGTRFFLTWARVDTLIDTDANPPDTILAGEAAGQFVSVAGALEDTVVVIEDPTLEDELSVMRRPAVAYVMDRYLVCWFANHPGDSERSRAHIHGRIVSPAGEVGVLRHTLTSSAGSRTGLRAVGAQESFLTTWTEFRGRDLAGVFASVVDTGGVVIESPDIKSNNTYTNGIDVVWTGTAYCFAYGSAPDDELDRDLASTMLSAAGDSVYADTLLSLSRPAQIPCCAAFDGSHYLAIWYQQVEGGWQLHGIRLDEEGTPVGDPIPLVSNVVLDAEPVTLAYGGGAYLLIWNDFESVYATALTTEGEQIDEPILLDAEARDGVATAAAYGDGHFLALWQHYTTSDRGYYVKQLTVAADSISVVPDTLLEFSSATGVGVVGTAPTLTFDGESFMALWGNPVIGIEGMIFPDSAWAAPPQAELFLAMVMPGIPQLMFDGAIHHLIYTHEETVCAARIRPDGEVLDPVGIPIDAGIETTDLPAIASDGYAGLAIWRIREDNAWKLASSRLRRDGSLIAGDERVIADESSMSRWPAAMTGNPGQILILYSGFLTDADHGTMRLLGKLWQQEPPGVSLTLHQNPGITSDVGILVFPSEELAEGTLTVTANGEPLTMILLDEEHNLYGGAYQARTTHVVTVRATIVDSVGNFGEASRIFAIGELDAQTGGNLAGPYGNISLACGPGAMATSAYVMILPDTDTDTGFLLSPPETPLLAPARLEVKVDGDGARPILERQTPAGWSRVETAWWPSSGTLDARISSLGRFRVRWTDDALDLSDARLQMRLGPEPWAGELGIRYRLPVTGPVQLAIFDVSGRRLVTLVDEVQDGGYEYTVTWDGRDIGRRPVASGVYFARLRLAGDVICRRSLRVR